MATTGYRRQGTERRASGLSRTKPYVTNRIGRRMEPANIFGWLATLASTVSFAPQAWKIIRTRETEDISLAMYAVTVFGFVCWTTYGALLSKWPIIVANSICFSLSAFILAMKALPRRKTEEVADRLDPEV
jgi:MtN3 and saliva related transmembrane protein